MVINLFKKYRTLCDSITIIESKMKEHYATCVDAFNPSTGNRKRTKGYLPYRDVSDFANTVTTDSGVNKPELKISKSEFLSKVNVDKKHESILNHPETEFLHIPERDSHIMYDTIKDVHHFYE